MATLHQRASGLPEGCTQMLSKCQGARGRLFEKGHCSLARGPIRARHRKKARDKTVRRSRRPVLSSFLGGPVHKRSYAWQLYVNLKPAKTIFRTVPGARGDCSKNGTVARRAGLSGPGTAGEEIKQCGEAAALFYFLLSGPEPKGNDASRFYVRFKPAKANFRTLPRARGVRRGHSPRSRGSNRARHPRGVEAMRMDKSAQCYPQLLQKLRAPRSIHHVLRPGA